MAEHTIEDAIALAEARRGKCLSAKYVHNHAPLSWQCGFGHRPWRASYSNVASGTWCPTCGRSVQGTIEHMRAVAKSRSGICLSETFVNFHVLLRWKCSNGHEWSASANNILGRGGRKGSWCPACAKNSRVRRPRPTLTIKDMQELARARGGRCDSQVYHQRPHSSAVAVRRRPSLECDTSKRTHGNLVPCLCSKGSEESGRVAGSRGIAGRKVSFDGIQERPHRARVDLL